MQFTIINLLLLGFLCIRNSAEQGFYENSDTLLEITPQNIHALVYNTSYVTFLEFYAPWCGYCRDLTPKIVMLGHEIKQKNVPVQIGIINCDEQENTPLCKEFGVQGLPSLYTVKPRKNINKYLSSSNKPSKSNYKISTYEGDRTFNPMMGALVELIDSPGFKAVKDPMNFINKVFDEASDAPVQPFLFYSYDETDQQSIKKMETMEHILKTVQKDFLIKINAFRVDKTIIDPLLGMMCAGNEDDLILQKVCAIYKKKGDLNNKLFLVDVENHDIHLFQKNSIEVINEFQSLQLSNFQVSTYKITSWIRNKINASFSVLGNGILSPRRTFVQENIFKNKYAPKPTKKPKKSKKNRKTRAKKNDTVPEFDEL